MLTFLREFAQDESGLTFVEYGLVAGLVSMVGVPVWSALGVQVTDWYSALNGEIITINEGMQ